MAKEGFSYLWRDRKRIVFGLPWSFTVYYLTETKVVTRTGLLNLAEDELDLYKVTDKKLVLPFWQRIIGCGTVILYVHDTDTPIKELRCIKEPRKVLEMLDKQIDAQRDRWNTRGRDMYGSGMLPPRFDRDHDEKDDE